MTTQTKNVLITSANGFVASHIIDQLIENGGYTITGTLRDASKGQTLYNWYPKYRDVVTFVSVPDFTVPTAFDEIFKSTPKPFDYIIHVASPLPIPQPDLQKDIIDPGPKGVLGLFTSAKKYGGPTLKRIVYTGSAVSQVDPFLPIDQPKTYDENDWSPVTAQQAIELDNPGLAYFASKILAEKTAGEFINREKPTFDWVSFLPVVILGPALKEVKSVDEVDQATKRFVYNFIDGSDKTLDGKRFDHYAGVDVRDVARAHVDGLTKPSTNGERISLSAPYLLSPQNVVDIMRRRFPQLKDRIVGGGDENVLKPAGIEPAVFKGTKATEIFGWEYKGLEETVVDIVNQLIEQEKTWATKA